MRIVSAFYVITLLFFSIDVRSQTASRVYLKPGDKVPDLVTKVTNYIHPTLKLSEFKGKVIILDIWGVYCSGCIEGMPRLERLQEQFKDNVKIITLCKHSRAQIQALAKRSFNVRNSKLTSISGEEKLAKLFDFQWLPVTVWIDQTGTLRYISDSGELDSTSLTAFIKGEEINISRKENISLDSEKPLLVAAYPYFGNHFSIYSYLAPLDYSKYRFGSWEETVMTPEAHPKRISGMFSLPRLYMTAFRSETYIPECNVLIKVKDSLKLKPDYYHSKNLYLYDLIVYQDMSQQRIQQYMKHQLDLFFKIKSKKEKKLIPCYVMQRTTNRDLLLSKGGQPAGEKSGNLYRFSNVGWQSVLGCLNGNCILLPLQVVDETGIDPQENVDLTMNIDFSNLDEVNKSLSSYGLRIIQADRITHVIILEDEDE